MRRVPALVADSRGLVAFVQQLAERVKHLRAATHRFTHRLRADGHDHAFLKLQRAFGVLAAVDHVHHRHGQRRGRRTAEIPEQRQREAARGCARDCQRHAQNRIGAYFAFVRRAVDFDQAKIDFALRRRVKSFQRRGKNVVDRGHGFQHAFAVVAFGVAVTQLDGFVRAHEAVELRDGDSKRYNGKGVLKAVAAVNDVLASALEGLDATAQREIDLRLIEIDGTPNKSKVGANAILGVSLAIARAAASSFSLPLFRYLGGPSAATLPVPMMNVINGGKHAEGALQFQECMIVPVGAESVREAVRCGSEVFHALGKLLHERNQPTTVGDEGGYAPHLDTLDEAMDLLVEAISRAGYAPGSDVAIALDAAATEFHQDGKYYPLTKDRAFTAQDMVAFYGELIEKYPVISIEDGLSEDDWDGWQKLTGAIGSKCQLVGDDLFVTNTERLERGIRDGIANSILIKVNQIGTLTETL